VADSLGLNKPLTRQFRSGRRDQPFSPPHNRGHDGPQSVTGDATIVPQRGIGVQPVFWPLPLLCGRRRTGFARLSGWQPVGNWVASAANFPTSLLPVGFTPKRAEESRPAVCPEKWPEAQAERVAGVHVFSSQKGRNHPPRLGSFFCRRRRARGYKSRKGDWQPPLLN
jgi:hypothetical protein